MSATSSAASDFSESEVGSSRASDGGRDGRDLGGRNGEVWRGDLSAVIGLQKRGLRGLMEGRRLRERGGSVGPSSQGQGRVGLGIGAL